MKTPETQLLKEVAIEVGTRSGSTSGPGRSERGKKRPPNREEIRFTLRRPVQTAPNSDIRTVDLTSFTVRTVRDIITGHSTFCGTTTCCDNDKSRPDGSCPPSAC